LIGVKTVLTAAHCVEGVAQTTVKVGVSFGLNASTAKSIPALALKKHPAYKPQLMRLANPVSPPNDIAIVTLSAPAPATHKPVAILSLTNALVVGEPLLLAGYGLTSPSGLDQSGVLRQVTTEITLLSEARKEIEFGNHPGRSACMGDSGGPAFVVRAGKIKLVGVTSRGSFFCDLDGVYTDARYFAAFIAANSK
jgi:secreted trypsin-like serine protease